MGVAHQARATVSGARRMRCGRCDDVLLAPALLVSPDTRHFWISKLVGATGAPTRPGHLSSPWRHPRASTSARGSGSEPHFAIVVVGQATGVKRRPVCRPRERPGAACRSAGRDSLPENPASVWVRLSRDRDEQRRCPLPGEMSDGSHVEGVAERASGRVTKLTITASNSGMMQKLDRAQESLLHSMPLWFRQWESATSLGPMVVPVESRIERRWEHRRDELLGEDASTVRSKTSAQVHAPKGDHVSNGNDRCRACPRGRFEQRESSVARSAPGLSAGNAPTAVRRSNACA